MFLKLNQLQITFDNDPVINALNLELGEREIGCLLGPSGCGKSTILRAIAGLQGINQGEITINNTLMSSPHFNLQPERRKVGMVFQDFALFPHKTVAENISFGLRNWNRKDILQRVDELLALVELPHLKDRYPHALSGGEQQRIALARALAPRPTLLLLDEPLSSLDFELRQELAYELREILVKEKMAAIFVTHDQMEAFAVADKIAIMQNGHIHQFAPSYEIYHKPRTRFVAEFIGQGVFINATVLDNNSVQSALGPLQSNQSHGRNTGEACELLIRPDDVIHDDRSAIKATIRRKMFRGSHFLYKVELHDKQLIFCMASSHNHHKIGEKIGIQPQVDHLVLF